MLDVIAVGAANIDFYFELERFPEKDGEVIAESFEQHFGGSACNFAFGCSRLGLKTALLTCLGKDAFGKAFLERLRKQGIDVSSIKMVDKATGAVAVLSGKNQRTMISFPGANDLIDEQMVEACFLKKAKLVHITSLGSEQAFKALVKAKETAKALGLKVSVDPGQILAEKGIDKIMPLLEGIDFFFPSKRELELLTGERNVEEACSAFSGKIGVIAATTGEKGCFVCTSREKGFVDAFKVHSADTTGAGDAFAAGFVYGFFHGKSPMECAGYGNLYAALSLKNKGAQESLLGEQDFLNEARELALH